MKLKTHRLFIVAVSLLLVFTSSCSDDSDQEQTPTDTEEYYIKYVVNSSTIYSGGELSVELSSENGKTESLTLIQNKKHEIIIGPVDKNFNATISIQAMGNTHNRLSILSEIHANKNSGPFALKEFDHDKTPRNELNLTYTIDF
jgi:hypothetical protein